MQPPEAPIAAGEIVQRRHDVDWLRVCALGLLIIYHVTITFQPWAFMIFFVQNTETMEGLWIFMSMINVWRIPILFLVSGMGVRFAMERRNWIGLLKDRAVRILIPLVFGYFFICPISAYIALDHYGKEPVYAPNAGHLWFLGNIFAYVLLLLPLFVYLLKKPDNLFFRALSRLFRQPFALFLIALPLMAEAWLVDPQIFVLYAETLHGFWLGMLCFLAGFVFVSLDSVFRQAVERIRHIALAAAFLLYLGRAVFELSDDINVLTAFESTVWMLAILGYGSRYLNKPSGLLAYLSKAVYPVYILHLPVQYGLSLLILPLSLSPSGKLALLLAGTFTVSLGIYELFIKRLRWIRPLFGMKYRRAAS